MVVKTIGYGLLYQGKKKKKRKKLKYILKNRTQTPNKINIPSSLLYTLKPIVSVRKQWCFWAALLYYEELSKLNSFVRINIE